MGTGIRDMFRRCKKAGLSEPEIRIDGGFFVMTIRRKKPEAGTKSVPGRHQVKAQVEAHEAQVTAPVMPQFIGKPESWQEWFSKGGQTHSCQLNGAGKMARKWQTVGN